MELKNIYKWINQR